MKLTSRVVAAEIAVIMSEFGFQKDSDAPGLWWHRLTDGGTPQAVRTVIWGLPSKPNPHLLVEFIPAATNDRLAERNRRLAAGDESVMDVQKVSLVDDWADRFRMTLMGRLP